MFKKLLTEWGTQHFRSFPWRQTGDPYYVLLAEVMLQRTRANQVVPVYLEMIEKYPSLEALADAPADEIARVMLPLGLTYRAKRLKAIAKMVILQFNGTIPSEANQLIQFPGIGHYIANAVCCFAFGKSLPIVDANILRILGRVFGLKFDANSHKKGEPWNFLKLFVRENAQQFNWALLDHGDMICTPTNPKCSVCPLSVICAYRQGQLEQLEEA